MPGKKRIICWDSCLFLDWLKADHTRSPEEVKGLREHVNLCQKNEAVMATSVITLTEVFEGKLNEKQKDLFNGLLKRPNFRRVQVTSRVAKTAHDIRQHFSLNVQDGLPTVSTPDALHLATAVFLDGCHEFYTFDGADEPRKGKTKGNRGLLNLDGFMRKQYGVSVSRPLSGDLSLL